MDKDSFNIIGTLLKQHKKLTIQDFFTLVKEYLGPYDIFTENYYFIIGEELLKRKNIQEKMYI